MRNSILRLKTIALWNKALHIISVEKVSGRKRINNEHFQCMFTQLLMKVVEADRTGFVGLSIVCSMSRLSR